MALPHYHLPLNLPHAGTVADRICTVLTQSTPRAPDAHAAAFETAETLRDLLAPFRFHENNPPAEIANSLQQQAAQLARTLVQEIARHKLGHDRLGQCIRNLFECLALGEEGAALSLQAGEHPHAVQRPRAKKLPPLSPTLTPEDPLPARPSRIRLHPKPEAKPAPKPVPRLDPANDVHLEPPGPIGEPEEGELGPPLDDSADLDSPPSHQQRNAPARKLPKIPGAEPDDGDWTFDP